MLHVYHMIAINASQVCISDGQICGTRGNVSATACCDGLKCVSVEHARGVQCVECPVDNTLKCLNCINSFNGQCGGPQKISCCPSIGFCVLTDHMDPNSFGRCIPPV
jgi:hypothetical protein